MNTKPTCLALAIAAVLGNSQALAQENSDQTPAELEAQTITATAAEDDSSYQVRSSSSATRLELSPRETPQSLTVVTEAILEDFQLDDVNQALLFTPGITVEQVETDRTYYTARGFDITNFQYDGLGAPFVYGNVGGDIDTALLERIEVLRGANGLMSGTGNPSATVNFVRKRPTARPQAEIDLTLGSWDRRRIEADVSGALNSAGTLRGRAVYAHEKGNSYLDRYGEETNVFYGVIEADLGQRTLLTLGHSLQKDDADSPLWGALPLYYSDGSATDFSRSTSTSADWSFWNNQEHRTFAELSHRLDNGWQIKGAVTRVEKDGDSRLFYMYGTPNPVTGLGLLAYPSLYEDRNEQWLADLYVSGPFSLAGREHELVAGLNWTRSELEDLSTYGQGIGTALPPLQDWTGAYPIPAFVSTAGSEFEDEQKSAYAASRLNLRDDLKLILGARATWMDAEGESYGAPRQRKDDAVTPYAGLVYDLNDNYSLYASYTDIFNPQFRTNAAGDRLDPVEGRSYELGVKGELFNSRLNVSAAMFRAYQDNIAESAGRVGGRTVYNGFDYQSQGYELEMSGELLPGLQGLAGYTFVDIENEDGRHARTYVPRHMLRGALTYRIPGMEQLQIGGRVSWQDDIYRDTTVGEIRQDSYALVGLMARYEIDDNWSVAANLDNLTDEKYITSLYWEQGYYGAPRNASMTLSWKY